MNSQGASVDAPVFLTLPKAARVLGVSAAMVRGMARDGALPTVKVGRRQMVLASSLTSAWFLRSVDRGEVRA